MVLIRALTTADLSAGQRLREQAGWNQTAADWHRLLTWEPDGCWVAERDRQVVGTTTVTTYGRRIAWIGMVLVDEAHRGQGIGKSLLTHALTHLDRLGVQTVALDSTPAGQPLYRRLGFVEQVELARWRGPLPGLPAGDGPFPTLALDDGLFAALSSGDGPSSGSSAHAVAIRAFTLDDLPAVVAYDARQFGVDRAHILGALLAGHPEACIVAERDGAICGYVMGRPGARAWHLGPLAAGDGQTADALVWTSLRAATTPTGTPPAAELLMDVVMPNVAAVRLAERLGLTMVRPFIRMTRGAPPPAIDLARVYTSAGPELG